MTRDRRRRGWPLPVPRPVTPEQFTAQLAAAGWPLNGRPIAEWDWWEV